MNEKEWEEFREKLMNEIYKSYRVEPWEVAYWRSKGPH